AHVANTRLPRREQQVRDLHAARRPLCYRRRSPVFHIVWMRDNTKNPVNALRRKQFSHCPTLSPVCPSGYALLSSDGLLRIQIQAAQKLSGECENNGLSRHQDRADTDRQRKTDGSQDSSSQRYSQYVVAGRPPQILLHLPECRVR